MVEDILQVEKTGIVGINSNGVYETIKSEDGSLDVNIHRAEANFLQGSFLNGISFTPLVAELVHSDGIVNFGIVPLPNNTYSNVTLYIEASINGVNYYPLCEVTLNGELNYYDFMDVHQASHVRLRADQLNGDSIQLFMSVR